MSLERDVKNVLLVGALLGATAALAQTRQAEPATDSAVQASPIKPVVSTQATDTSAEASPIAQAHGVQGRTFTPHTALHVVLIEGIDSGNLKNGQMVHARLESSSTAQASGSSHTSSRAGIPAILTVVGTVPAGKLNAVGEISLELVRVGGQSVDTNILTFRGVAGHRDLPDSAPMIGTNAGLPAGTALTFVVQPAPSFSERRPGPGRYVPGSVTGHMSGSKPSNYGQPTVSSAPGSGVDKSGAPISSAGDQPQPAQNSLQPGSNGNQMQAPPNASPTSTTKPR